MHPFEFSAAQPLGKFIHLADTELRLISVFDDLKYDRADGDLLSTGMRRHAVTMLAGLGFKQISGRVLAHQESGICCHIPKFHALGASPFDITRFAQRGPEDYFLLTPTQVACQYIDHYTHELAVDKIKSLVARHPINLLRIEDYLEKGKAAHDQFRQALGHLVYVQRMAVESEPLKTMRALG